MPDETGLSELLAYILPRWADIQEEKHKPLLSPTAGKISKGVLNQLSKKLGLSVAAVSALLAPDPRAGSSTSQALTRPYKRNMAFKKKPFYRKKKSMYRKKKSTWRKPRYPARKRTYGKQASTLYSIAKAIRASRS